MKQMFKLAYLGAIILKLSIGLMIACSSNCPNESYRSYKYRDKVHVISGFYKGHTGYIHSRAYLVDNIKSEACRFLAFEVDLEEIRVRIRQSELELK